VQSAVMATSCDPPYAASLSESFPSLFELAFYLSFVPSDLFCSLRFDRLRSNWDSILGCHGQQPKHSLTRSQISRTQVRILVWLIMFPTPWLKHFSGKVSALFKTDFEKSF
jgi:hypothetical protein